MAICGCLPINNGNRIQLTQAKINLKSPLLLIFRPERPVWRFTAFWCQTRALYKDNQRKVIRFFCGIRTNILLWDCIIKKREKILEYCHSVFSPRFRNTLKRKNWRFTLVLRLHWIWWITCLSSLLDDEFWTHRNYCLSHLWIHSTMHNAWNSKTIRAQQSWLSGQNPTLSWFYQGLHS